MRKLSLKARLLLGVFALAAVALVAADAATYLSLQSFLFSRVDSTLEAGHSQVEQLVLGSGGPNGNQQPHHDDDDHSGPAIAGIDWYEVRALSGHVLTSGFLIGGGSAPALPARIATPTQVDRQDPAHERAEYFTVTAKNGSTSYRIRASIDPDHPNRVLVIAVSLNDEFATLHRLLLIELLVTIAALAAISATGFWVVRIGLRPLAAIESTAEAIAGGDLSRRVERAEAATEVGRLGLSLNAMLGQIEAAFTVRTQSEARLRQFVADASHELRTPLAAVRAYAELFDRGAAQRQEDLARSMSGITREAQRMSLLVEDLLLLARLDEDRPVALAQLDLADVVLEAVDAARAVEPDRPVTISLEPVPVMGDHPRLRQAIDNLFANVRTHTPAGEPVDVSLRRVGPTAELRVADHGPGLTEEQARRVFERFYRVDSSRTRASGGVGLGLSIVAAIVAAHHGDVRVEPTPGGGATFVIILPLAS